MLRVVVAVICGFLLASAIMLAFEFANSRLFPFPPGMDTSDIGQVRAFAKSLPSTALLLVLAGWIAGALVGGATSALIGREGGARAAVALGLLLTAGAAFNAWLIRHPWWFHVGGLLLFLPLTRLGQRLAARRLAPPRE